MEGKREPLFKKFGKEARVARSAVRIALPHVMPVSHTASEIHPHTPIRQIPLERLQARLRASGLPHDYGTVQTLQSGQLTGYTTWEEFTSKLRGLLDLF